MKVHKNTSQPRGSGPSALVLIEESVHLLRRAPTSVHLLHLLGSGVWVLGLLFAWAYVSWFRPPRDELAFGAAGLVLLYAWLKTMQSEMCARLMAFRLGAKPEPFTARRAAQLAKMQFPKHAWGASVLLAVCALIVPMGWGWISIAVGLAVPLAWVWLYFQNVTILGTEKHDAGPSEAWSLTRLWPQQANIGMLVLALLAVVVFLNMGTAFYMLPWFARTMFGVKNMMALSGWSPANTTFLMSVLALTWLAVDPLAKTFCVLRVFHGRALRTGADLRIEMDAAHSARAMRTGAARAAALLVLACLIFGVRWQGEAATPLSQSSTLSAPQSGVAVQSSLPTHAKDGAPSSQTMQSAELDRAIDEVLQRRDFRWQLQPEKNAAAEKENEGVIMRFFNWLGRGLRSVGEAISGFVNWLERLFASGTPRGETQPATTSTLGAGILFLKIILYALLIAFAVLLVWVIYLAVRRTRSGVVQAEALGSSVAAKPDLRDDTVQATQLPSDGWLQLAREQAALGEWRLALRALYLAHLARLDAEGLVTLRRHKTNLDYERELRRRALQRAELVEWFGARRREFEAAWYGRAQPDEKQVRTWFAEVEKGAAALP